MAKQRERKRQRKDVPLGEAVTQGPFDDEGKDDEERRLEALLFGTPYVPGPQKKSMKSQGKEAEKVPEGPSELEYVLDQDLFFYDEAGPSNSLPTGGSALKDDDAMEQYDSPQGSDDDEGRSSPSRQDPGSEDESGEEEEKVPESSYANLSSSRKPAAWVDPADAQITVSLANDKRLRKLRDGPSDDTIDGKDYERRLRRQYEKMHPTPEWATNARAKLHKSWKRARSTSPSYEEDDLLHSTNGIIASESGSKSALLPSGSLSIERLRDANQAARTEGEVKVVRFHPSPSVPVLLAGVSDRRIRLFNVDGLTNPLLQTLHIPELPFTSASFNPTGSSVLITGPRPFYYSYDLQSGQSTRSPRGLWLGVPGGTGGGGEDRSMEISAFSDDGKLVAVGGRSGYIHILDWVSGGGQVTASLKMNTPVKDVCWVKGKQGKELMSLGQDAEVYLWDVRSKRCINRWKDDGAFGAGLLETDPIGKYYAIGSNTGIVNVYGNDHAVPTPTGVKPKPLKALTNLTTAISTIRFDSSSQILAIASRMKKDQLRVVHLPTLNVFSNWPTSGTPLGTVTSVDFSAGSEYIAVGNTRGRVLLYQLRHFASSM